MKNLFVILVILISHSLSAQSQSCETDIPLEVKIQFMEDFISATDIVWAKKSDVFIASFIHHSHYKCAAYSASGTRVYVTTKVSPTVVPSHLMEKLNSDAGEDFILDEVIIKETGQEVIFSFTIRDDDFTRVLCINAGN